MPFQKNHKINYGKKLSEEHKSKIGKANKGKIRTVEQRKNISLSHKGNGHKHSKETIRKMSLVKLGKQLSNEHKKNLSISHKGLFSGSKHYNWQGGKSFEKYTIDWTNSLKISIRERDKYTCQICGEKQNNRAHQVHHINYIKTDCNPDNLITLCVSCHTKTNFNREKWTEYFKFKNLII